jgi:hypothetical protein
LPNRSLRRIAAALWREAVLRRTPHGLINLGYLRPRPAPEIALHRALWLDALPGWPRPVVAVIETFLWLRWTLFGAWRATWRALRAQGAETQARDGIPIRRQAARLLGLALRWGIPPGQACSFGLQRPPGARSRGARDPALRYVFEPERAAWHRHLNAGDPGRDRAVALLRDKSALAACLAQAGIDVVSTWATWTPGEPLEFAGWVGTHVPAEATAFPGLFFKLRDGVRGLHAFAAWQRDGAWEGAALGEPTVRGLEAVQALWQALTRHGAVIVQPRLATHPALAPLAGNDEAVTVRVITRREAGGGAGATMAMLEVPLAFGGLHAVWPVDASAGAVSRSTWDGRPANAVPDAVAPRIRPPEPALRIPDWERLARQSGEAHDLVAALVFIAWDWIVTPDGARLLEGNSGWNTGMPQRLFGSLGCPTENDCVRAWHDRAANTPAGRR